MSGFAGFTNFIYRRENTELVLKQMTDSIMRRGVDVEAYYDDLYTHIGFRCRVLSNMESKKKAMNLKQGNNEYMIVLDGELYNKKELIQEENLELNSNEDEEIILKLYDKYGEKFVEKIVGIFAMAIWSKDKKVLFLARDSSGLKPLFYTIQDSNFIFSSEVKAILLFPEMKAYITEYGIANIFLKGVIPMKSKPLFKDVYELEAGEYLIYKPSKVIKKKYNGNIIENVKGPVIKTIDKKINLTEGEIRNIVKIRDIPNRIIEDVMLIKSCEKVQDGFTFNSFNNITWKSTLEIRKELLSPNLKINIEEFYNFQKNKSCESIDFTSIDRISNRFGYNAILPQIDFIIEEENIRKIFKEMVESIDSPILDLINKRKVIDLFDEIDIDTIIYLIEVNMWMEEYRVNIY